ALAPGDGARTQDQVLTASHEHDRRREPAGTAARAALTSAAWSAGAAAVAAPVRAVHAAVSVRATCAAAAPPAAPAAVRAVRPCHHAHAMDRRERAVAPWTVLPGIALHARPTVAAIGLLLARRA